MENGHSATYEGMETNITVIESRSVNYLLTKLRDKTTKGKVSKPI